MAIPVIEGTAITNLVSNATADTITLPASVAANDIIIIICAMDGAPTGFASSGGITMTEFMISAEASDCTIVALWGRASGGETVQNLTWTGSQQGRFMALRISGALESGSPIDVVGAASSSGGATTLAITALTPGETDTLAIASVCVDRDRVDATDGLSTANGFTETGISGSSGGANGAGLIVAEKDMPTITSTLSPTFGTWASDECVGRMFNVKEQPAGTGFAHSQVVIT